MNPLRPLGRILGQRPLAEAGAELARAGARLRAEGGWVLGVNGGTHDAGAALVRVEDALARVELVAEEERWSRRRHDAGAPERSIAAALDRVRAAGGTPQDVVLRACGWDFAAFAAAWAGEVVRGLPASLGLLRGEGFVDLPTAALLAGVVSRALGRPDDLIAVPHHEAHAWGSLLPSPFHDGGEDVLILVADGMGDRGSLSVHLAPAGREPACLHDNASLFDSLGLLYQVLSSTQGGWTPLASEGRFMGAAAWGDADRSTNPVYPRLRPLVRLLPEGRIALDRAWMRWHRTPRAPYGPPLREVLGPPIPTSDLWDPDAVLDPSDHRAPALTQARLERAAAVQMVFEDALAHVLDHWLGVTGARRVVWTGGTALNVAAALHLVEDRPGLAWWTPPVPGDNGVALGAALRVAWATGAVRRVAPLPHAFLGGTPITAAGVREALARDPAEVIWEGPADEAADHVAALLVRGAILGVAHGAAESGPRALGHRSILADPTRPDARARLNAHVKRRETVRPLAPMALPDAARRWFDLPSALDHHDLDAWRFMVQCARARPGTAEALPAVVHVDGTARLQVVDPDVDPFIAGVLEGLRARNGAAVAVNTSLNVGEPIAHTPADALRTLDRARDLHGVVFVDETGHACLVARPDRPAGASLQRWSREAG